MSRVIITGINGFVAKHVVNAFSDAGFDVVGIGREAQPNESVAHKLAHYYMCDILDTSSVRMIDFSNIHAVIHLAGLSNVGDSYNQPLPYITDNAIMAYNLLSQAKTQNFGGRFIVVSSGALYNPHQSLPLSEESTVLENSPYAVGKLAVEHVTRYFRLRGLDAIIARPFNHIGPGQGLGFIAPDLYAQLRTAHAEGRNSILVGNLATRRDYTDVRDVVQAYVLLTTTSKLNYDLYNVCTGRSLSGLDILSTLKQTMNITNIEPVVDDSKVRPTDIMEIYGDSSRLHSDTGWQPKIDIQQTIRDFVEIQQ